MTALNADRSLESRQGVILTLPVLAATKIYGGSLVAIDANGYAQPAADTTGLKVVGVAKEQVDNSNGASGDVTVKIERGMFSFVGAALTIADRGKTVYVADDQTVQLAATANKIPAGTLIDIDGATKAWVFVPFNIAEGQADSVAADVATIVIDFNSLLAKLRSAGLMGTD